jgi:hypothetical protein
MTALTAGLKCAPLTGPKTSISTYSPPTPYMTTTSTPPAIPSVSVTKNFTRSRFV